MLQEEDFTEEADSETLQLASEINNVQYELYTGNDEDLLISQDEHFFQNNSNSSFDALGTS